MRSSNPIKRQEKLKLIFKSRVFSVVPLSWFSDLWVSQVMSLSVSVLLLTIIDILFSQRRCYLHCASFNKSEDYLLGGHCNWNKITLKTHVQLQYFHSSLSSLFKPLLVVCLFLGIVVVFVQRAVSVLLPGIFTPHERTHNMHLRDRSAETTLRPAALRWKLQIQFDISPSHTTQTLGQPVLALILWRQAPGTAATKEQVFFWWLVWFHRGKGDLIPFIFFYVPSYISGVHHFGWEFCLCDRF